MSDLDRALTHDQQQRAAEIARLAAAEFWTGVSLPLSWVAAIIVISCLPPVPLEAFSQTFWAWYLGFIGLQAGLCLQCDRLGHRINLLKGH